MDILERYQHDLNTGLIYDPAQEIVIKRLAVLAGQFVNDQQNSSLLKRWFFRGQGQQPVKGLYIWGDVGRGKTYLMDVFYQHVACDKKKRLHFHRFMQQVHADLNTFKGHSDPLSLVAKQWAKETKVLCFDEFFVADIGDAMILAGLLKGLFAQGVSLVATSNIPPKRLYEDGLQRTSFLPAIALLEQYCDTLELSSEQDYRLRALTEAKMYHITVLGDHTALSHCFAQLAAHVKTHHAPIEIFDRVIPVICTAEDTAWFGFQALCNSPRSAADYIELAKQFHTVLVSDVPVFNNNNEDAARRFIHLVDEFYDRKVKLILSAVVDMLSLYQGARLAFEFHRTISRLQEMQSQEYLTEAHRP
ncbi:cell division protein ZapE [Piscirickettsia salmonis]|uniref:cell division protein ZapE n=1 Tax=Piscirickettsia salmonis TaxID=1238 RepID=UPI000F086922|nr:cell division protein ZapE [Piscirickettsiaceae bacterium NZ-RLO2]